MEDPRKILTLEEAKILRDELTKQINEMEGPPTLGVSMNEKRLKDFYVKAIPYLQAHAKFLQLVGNFPVWDNLTRLIHMHVLDK